MKKCTIAEIGAVVIAVMLTGCSYNESDAVGVIGGADGPTAVIVGEQISAGEDEAFFREMYFYDLNNKYNQLITDQDAFFNANDNANYAVSVEDLDSDAFFAAAEKCISSFEAIIAIEPPESLASYHEQLIEGAQYEIKFLNGVIQATKYDLGELDMSEQEREELQAFFTEYSEAETNRFVDAYCAVMEAIAQ